MVFPVYDEQPGSSTDKFYMNGLLSTSIELLEECPGVNFQSGTPWEDNIADEVYKTLPSKDSFTDYHDALKYSQFDETDERIDAVYVIPTLQELSPVSAESNDPEVVVNSDVYENGITLNLDADGEFNIASKNVSVVPSSFDISVQSSSAKSRKDQNQLIESLIGHANLISARGNVPDAIKLLHDIIRQQPRHPEAYFQLAHIYDLQGFELKSFEYRLLGCNVDRNTSANDWDAAGDIAITLGKQEEAAACFGKAAKVAPKQWIYYEKRIRACEQTGHIARAMKTRLVAAQNVDCHASGFDFVWLHSMIKAVAEYYNNNDDEDKCVNALSVHVRRCKEFNVDASEQHEILIQQLLRRNEYSRAAESIVVMCAGFNGSTLHGYPAWMITDKFTASPWPPGRVAYIEVDSGFPTLMLCRLVLCFSKMKLVTLASQVFAEMFRRGFDPNSAGLYADVARVFVELEEYEHGEGFTANLLQYHCFVNDAELFYLHGFFNEKLNRFDIAEYQYNHALKLDPSHVDARVCLSQMLQNRNDTNGALNVLANFDLSNCSHYPDQRILLRQAELLETSQNPETYLQCIQLLLAPHFHLVLRRQQQTMIVKRHRNCVNLPINLKKLLFAIARRASFTRMIEDMGQFVMENNRELILQPSDVHKYSLKLFQRLSTSGRDEEALQVIAYVTLYPLLDEPTTTSLTNLLFMASLHASDYVIAFECIRFHIVETDFKFANGSINETTFQNKRQRLFLSLGHIAVQHQSQSMQRFIDRYYTKSLDNVQLKMLVANNALVGGSYKTAIYLYNQVDQLCPNSLAKLNLGVAFVGLACKKTVTNRISLGVRALAMFTQYMRMRESEGLSQEAYYNVGRMFHGMGFFTQAVFWYEKCLMAPDPLVYRNNIPLPSETYSMKPLAAFNYIHIIAKNNPLKARQLRHTYCIL